MLLGRVWKEGDRPCPLQRAGQRALVSGAGAGHAPRQDLAAVAHEAPQARDLLVVDVVDLLDAEAAHLAMLALRTSPRRRGAFTWSVYCHRSLLKRDVVRVDIAWRVVRSGNVVMGGRGGAVSDAGPAARAARLEELNVVGDDLGDASLLAILAFPRAGLDASFDVHQRPLAGVLRDGLGKIPLADWVRHDVVVVGELLALAVRSRRPAIGGDAEVGHRRATWRVAHLRVLR